MDESASSVMIAVAEDRNYDLEVQLEKQTQDGSYKSV